MSEHQKSKSIGVMVHINFLHLVNLQCHSQNPNLPLVNILSSQNITPVSPPLPPPLTNSPPLQISCNPPYFPLEPRQILFEMAFLSPK